MIFQKEKHLRHLSVERWQNLFDDHGCELKDIFGKAGASEIIEGGEFGIDLISMNPGSWFPLHTHSGHHLLFGLEGNGFVHIDGVDHFFSRGDSIYIAADYPHGVSAAKSLQKFELLAIGYPHKGISAHDRMKVIHERT